MESVAVEAALALLEKFSSIIDRESNRRNDVQSDINRIKNLLKSMKAFLKDKEGEAWTEVVKEQVRQIRDFAYDIEDIIAEHQFRVPEHFHSHWVSQLAHDWRHYGEQRNALIDLSSKIKDIGKTMESLKFPNEFFMNFNSGGASSSITRPVNHCGPHRAVDDEVFGFEEFAANICNQLLENKTGESLRSSTVSIVGRAGSGKTVLATKVFEDHKVREAFHFTYWANVSTPFNVDPFLRSIELSMKYLIVLDDVRRKEDLEHIIDKLPRGAPGSRIMITSRNREIASYCNPRLLHDLYGLKGKDAWKLFCSKVFGNIKGDCPHELVEWADNIITKCEGLPLYVSTVGSMLSNKPRIPVEWKKFHDSMGNNHLVIEKLLPDYNDLRHQSDLKSCFLYLGVFPADYPIQRERLFRLWIAERFLEEKDNHNVEDLAEDILKELVARNLISVSKQDVDGRVRCCQVPILVRDFIIVKAQEESFLRVLDEGSAPSRNKVRRFSAIANPTMTSLFDENLSQARSAFFLKEATFGSFSKSFKLLKVLDMKDAPLERFSEDILRLCLLKYLSLQNTKIQEIPGSIEKLSLLETLDLKQTLVTQLPNNIFRLRKLRYLLVYRYEMYVPFDGVKGVQIGHGIGALIAIRKLTLIKVTSKIIKGLGCLVHLRKLGIVGLKQKHAKILSESLQKMPHLSTLDVKSETEEVLLDLDSIPSKPMFEHLQRLYLKGRLEKIPRWVSSLGSLIKVHLKWSRLQEDSPLEVLENLPNLMELVMFKSYTGNCLEFKAGTFGKLKVLIIEQLTQLNTIMLQQGSMPEIEKLEIRSCNNLKVLPLGIHGLSKLKEFILRDMDEEFLDKLKKHEDGWIGHIKLIEAYDLRSNLLWSYQSSS